MYLISSIHSLLLYSDIIVHLSHYVYVSCRHECAAVVTYLNASNRCYGLEEAIGGGDRQPILAAPVDDACAAAIR